jgi:uncharacterized protein YbjT (DUF2867 family)
VRAAARDVEQARANTDIAVQFGLLAPEQLSRLSWVDMDLEDPDSIPAAIGNASRVRVSAEASCIDTQQQHTKPQPAALNTLRARCGARRPLTTGGQLRGRARVGDV